MEQTELATLIGTLGGAAITLILAYVPGLKSRWEQLDGAQKRMWLGALYLALSAGLYVPSCFGGPVIVTCDTTSIWNVALAFLMALVAGQSTYTALPTAKKAAMSGRPVAGDLPDA